MAIDNCILAIDQGTTSSRAIIFDTQSNIISIAQQEFTQHYPADGWVEHDPDDIWQSTLSVCQQAISEAVEKGAKVVAMGITNQRETTLVWNRETGEPLYNAIVWQDRRTASECRALTDQGLLDTVQSKTGLLLDPYFSASKVAWILDNVEGARASAEKGELAFGTVDSYLIWRLTKGESHFTDITNASRTNLFNIHTQAWDNDLLDIFNVPESMLPEVKECADDFGICHDAYFGFTLPILGVAGDQQAASVGQCCFSQGSIKSTYGTGCFVMLNTGKKAFRSNNQLLTTIAYKVQGETHYALEGSIFIAGAAIQWLRDGIKVIESASETQALSASLNDDHGVMMVPAFAGMGAPYWQPDARGAIYGLTRGTTNAHLARAALESVCYQTADLLAAMAEDGVSPDKLRVDGGMVANDWVCQCLSNILSIEVERPSIMETTALGAAYLAGLQAGIFKSTQDLMDKNRVDSAFKSTMSNEKRATLMTKWKKAVEATLIFASN